jgi:hypothetical protein
MRNLSPWKILTAEIGYFFFVLLGIYAGHALWKATIGQNIDKYNTVGVIYSIFMLIVIILAAIAVLLNSLKRLLVKNNVISKEDSLRFLRSRTWFMNR